MKVALIAAITSLIILPANFQSNAIPPLDLIATKFFEIVDTNLTRTECAADLRKFLLDLYHLKAWAVKMLDASGKINSGIFYGNYRLQGNYDQCLSIKTKVEGRRIAGQYCHVSLIFDKNKTLLFFDWASKLGRDMGRGKFNLDFFLTYFRLSFGLCVPKSCSVKILETLWSHVEEEFKVPAKALFAEESCYYKNKTTRSNRIDPYVYSFFVAVLFIVLGSTSYDLVLRKRGAEPDIFVTFSLYTNSQRLLSIKCENDSLTCLYGIRVISILWIIVAHLAITKGLTPVTNALYIIAEWRTRIENTYILGAPYMVDTFFSMSGILVVYVYLKRSEKIKIGFLEFYVFRALRLIPALLATVLFSISVIKHLVNSPISNYVIKVFTINCEERWWTTLFFLTNYVHFEDQCIQQSWFLSVDTKLYVISPVILFGIKKNPRRTFLAVLVACLVSYVYSWSTVMRHNLPFIIALDVGPQDTSYVYYSTIARMPSWLIGTFFGYLLYRHSIHKIQLAKNTNLFLWLVSLMTMLTLVLFQVVFGDNDHEVLLSAFFNSFSRSIWSLAVCFIIFSCSTGHGGIINDFLSHPVFIVLGKLTYSMFLIHLPIIYLVMFNKKHPGYFSNFEIFFEFWGIFVITLSCSVIMCLIFETPVISLGKHLVKYKAEKTKSM